MDDYKGVIIEESLEKKDILKKVKIISTEIEKVTEQMKTPWLKNWTLHTVLIPEEDAYHVTDELSASLEDQHSSWYADYQNKKWHYIIFKGKIFKVNKSNPEEYRAAMEYGVSLGIPKHQVNFLNE
ncbi:MAG: hypothetical protein V4481_00795 [Patescibacteria group bacterium]